MKVILLKGHQGSLKTSTWGAAIARFFEQSGKTVHYLDCVGPLQEEFDRAIATGSDVIIVDTNLDHFPFSGPQPDFTVSFERHNPHSNPVSHG